MHKYRWAVLVVPWLYSASILATNIEHQEKPVIVTATRTAQTAESSLASVSVITRQDIERQQVR